jgi:hypothetical protein
MHGPSTAAAAAAAAAAQLTPKTFLSFTTCRQRGQAAQQNSAHTNCKLLEVVCLVQQTLQGQQRAGRWASHCHTCACPHMFGVGMPAFATCNICSVTHTIPVCKPVQMPLTTANHRALKLHQHTSIEASSTTLMTHDSTRSPSNLPLASAPSHQPPVLLAHLVSEEALEERSFSPHPQPLCHLTP